MKITSIILPIAIGALIGYCTNYIAIKMLFLPRKEYRIGKWKLPFTPGVIPKNKPRLASAVGTAISERLFTESDLLSAVKDSGIREKIVETVTDTLTQSDLPLQKQLNVMISDTQIETAVDRLSLLLSQKIITGAKALDFHAIIREIAQSSFSKLLSNPVLSLFFNGNSLDTAYEKVGNALMQYLDTYGIQKAQPIIKAELQQLLKQPIKEDLSDQNITKETVRQLVSKTVNTLIETQLPKLTGMIDIQKTVADKINEMDVRELETLVLSVMKNELQTVVNLGAVLGAVIGILNIFI